MPLKGCVGGLVLGENPLKRCKLFVCLFGLLQDHYNAEPGEYRILELGADARVVPSEWFPCCGARVASVVASSGFFKLTLFLSL